MNNTTKSPTVRDVRKALVSLSADSQKFLNFSPTKKRGLKRKDISQITMFNDRRDSGTTLERRIKMWHFVMHPADESQLRSMLQEQFPDKRVEVRPHLDMGIRRRPTCPQATSTCIYVYSN